MESHVTKLLITIPIIWVIGGPGCGKGTQCAKIAAKYNFLHLSVGQLIREQVKTKTERAQNLKDIMNRGDLIPDEIIIDVVREELFKNLCNIQGVLIDGFPRHERQGVLFEANVSPTTGVLYLEISDKAMWDRLRQRALSSGRSDDKEHVMEKRISTFKDNIRKIVSRYSHKLKTINGEKSINATFREVENYMEALVVEFDAKTCIQMK